MNHDQGGTSPGLVKVEFERTRLNEFAGCLFGKSHIFLRDA
jgi:hypothetical protein